MPTAYINQKVKTKVRQDLTALSVVLIYFILLSVAGFYLTRQAADSFNLVVVYNIDEYEILRDFKTALESWSFNPNNAFKYGYNYQTVGLLILWFVKLLGAEQTSETAMIVTLRAVSFFSFLISSLLVYLILRKIKVVKPSAIVFTIFFAAFTSNFDLAVQVHPDSLQLLFLTFAIYKLTVNKFYHSCFFAGLAFGTKYGGIFLLPFIFMYPIVLNFLQLEKTNLINLATRIVRGIELFLAAWLVFNPYVLLNFQEWVTDMKAESAFRWDPWNSESIAISGITDRLFKWGICLYNEIQWQGMTMISFVLIAALYIILSKKRGALSQFFYAHAPAGALCITLVSYGLAYFAFLSLTCNYIAGRFLMPAYFALAIPFAILASWILVNTSRVAYVMANNALLLMACWLCADSVLSQFDSKEAAAADDRIEIGNFVARKLGNDIKVLADPYSYFPPNYFKLDPIVTWNIVAAEAIQTFDVIMINKKYSGRFNWKEDGTKFEEGKFISNTSKFAAEYKLFHQFLLSKDSNFRIINENENALAFERVNRQVNR